MRKSLLLGSILALVGTASLALAHDKATDTEPPRSIQQVHSDADGTNSPQEVTTFDRQQADKHQDKMKDRAATQTNETDNDHDDD